LRKACCCWLPSISGLRSPRKAAGRAAAVSLTPVPARDPAVCAARHTHARATRAQAPPAPSTAPRASSAATRPSRAPAAPAAGPAGAATRGTGSAWRRERG
jgi:hypothetical protein